MTTPRRMYCFGEDELVDLLIKYEHLLEQEAEAQRERIDHEPALPYARRLLRERKPLTNELPVRRPLDRKPFPYNHVGERDWVHYSDTEEATDEMDDEELLYNACRDLTDEELARILSA